MFTTLFQRLLLTSMFDIHFTNTICYPTTQEWAKSPPRFSHPYHLYRERGYDRFDDGIMKRIVFSLHRERCQLHLQNATQNFPDETLEQREKFRIKHGRNSFFRFFSHGSKPRRDPKTSADRASDALQNLVGQFVHELGRGFLLSEKGCL